MEGRHLLVLQQSLQTASGPRDIGTARPACRGTLAVSAALPYLASSRPAHNAVRNSVASWASTIDTPEGMNRGSQCAHPGPPRLGVPIPPIVALSALTTASSTSASRSRAATRPQHASPTRVVTGLRSAIAEARKPVRRPSVPVAGVGRPARRPLSRRVGQAAVTVAGRRRRR